MSSYTKGRRQFAQRRAHNILDKWLEATGVITIHSGYYYELLSILDDAVECGAQEVLEIHEPLDSEQPCPPSR